MAKKSIIILIAAMIAASCGQITVRNDHTKEWKSMEKQLNFYLASDLGRNGWYEQKPIAGTMGKMAETIDVDFVLAAGDVHHFDGVRSTSDPLWLTNYEFIYSHPDLMIPWYPVCGNHEYRGCTKAVTDYSNVSARWRMPAKYYTFVKEKDGVSIRFVMTDTTPLIDRYRDDPEEYPDASADSFEDQLSWLDKVLSGADEDWVIVVGHHPVYAETGKNGSEQTDLQERLNPILVKYGNVDMYLSGHIHTFQHIRKDGCDIDYVVNSSGSQGRDDIHPSEDLIYFSDRTGWSLLTADEHELDLYMLDRDGRVLHKVSRTR